MANKNPFEIRAEVLEMAKDYMDKQMSLNVDYAEKMFKASQISAKEVKEAMSMYSMDEMLKKAQEMYSFVSKKD